jgi:hypothetical protein
MMGGFISGTLNVLIGHPLDTVRTRVQASTKNAGNAIHIAKKLIALEGFSAFYNGLPFPLLTGAINQSIYLSTY